MRLLKLRQPGARASRLLRLALLLALQRRQLVSHLGDLQEQLLLRLEVAGAEDRRSLEGHVLEQVRQAGVSGLFVDSSGFDADETGENWSFGALDDQPFHPVFEPMLPDDFAQIRFRISG